MRSQSRPGWASFRLRIRNLPLSYAEHAPGSERQLHELIANALDMYTFNVETDQRWTAPSTPVAWAFLNVKSYEKGTKLIDKIDQVRLGGRRMQTPETRQ